MLYIGLSCPLLWSECSVLTVPESQWQASPGVCLSLFLHTVCASLCACVRYLSDLSKCEQEKSIVEQEELC